MNDSRRQEREPVGPRVSPNAGCVVKLDATHNDSLPTARRGRRETRSMEVAGMAEGDRVVGVRVAHGWDAETAAPLVLLHFAPTSVTSGSCR